MSCIIPDLAAPGVTVRTASEVLNGLDRGGLITVIVVSIIAIAAFVWIFHETGRRD